MKIVCEEKELVVIGSIDNMLVDLDSDYKLCCVTVEQYTTYTKVIISFKGKEGSVRYLYENNVELYFAKDGLFNNVIGTFRGEKLKEFTKNQFVYYRDEE